MNLSIFKPTPHTLRHNWTSTNGSSVAAIMILFIFTDITSVNDNAEIFAMSRITDSVYIVACVSIVTLDIIPVVLIVTASNDTASISILIFLLNISISFNTSIIVSISIKFIELVLLLCLSASLWTESTFIFLWLGFKLWWQANLGRKK